jgi:molecular chaperone GrpE
VAMTAAKRGSPVTQFTFRLLSTAPPPPPDGAAADLGSQPADEPAAKPTEVSSEASKVDKLEAEVKDLKDKVLRSLAEEENVRRIAKRDVENAKAYATSSMAKSLLEVADNLDLALQAAKTGGGAQAGKDPLDNRTGANDTALLKSLIEGVEATNKGLLKSFAQFGIVKV